MNKAHPQVRSPVFRLLARALPLDSLSDQPLSPPPSFPLSLLSFTENSWGSRHREFPGGPVVRTPRSRCWGLGSIPCWETKIPQAAWHPPPLPLPKKEEQATVKRTSISPEDKWWRLSQWWTQKISTHFGSRCGFFLGSRLFSSTACSCSEWL